jgi:hypothetical protein
MLLSESVEAAVYVRISGMITSSTWCGDSTLTPVGCPSEAFVFISVPVRECVGDQISPVTAVAVLGMHRSGTSSVAGALVCLGGAAPLHLMRPEPDNERGFWESPVIMALNEEVLAAGGSHWLDWRKFDYARINCSVADALRERAKATLAAEFGEAGIPVIKDPRMCRLMRFWAPAFEEMGWSMRAVLPLRSPLEVAWSLKRRNGVSDSLGCLLWLRHVLEAEAETRGMTRAVLNWPDFVGNSREALERLVHHCGLRWPRWGDEGLADVDAFVSGGLRHCKADADDLQADPGIGDLARDVYVEMLGLVEDPNSAASWARLDNLRARFESAVALFDPAMHDFEGEMRCLAQSLAQANRKLEQANCKLEQANRKLDQANAVIASVTRRYADQNSAAMRNGLRRFGNLAGRQATLEAVRNSAFFDAAFYLEANPDVRERGLDPAVHYLMEGARQERDPGPHFSTSDYLARNPDVAEAGVNALVHYEMRGRKENRPAIG